MGKLTQEERQNLINEYNDTNSKKQMLTQRLQAIQAVIAKDETERKAIYDEITTLNNEIKELNSNLSRIENIIEEDKQSQLSDNVSINTGFFNSNFAKFGDSKITFKEFLRSKLTFVDFLIITIIMALSWLTITHLLGFIFNDFKDDNFRVMILIIWSVVLVVYTHTWRALINCIKIFGTIIILISFLNHYNSHIDDKNERLKLLHLANAQLICDRYFLQNAKYDGAKTGNIAGTLDNDSKKTGYVFTDAILVNGFGAKKRVGYVCYISKNFDENTISTITNEQDEITFQKHLDNGDYDKYVVDFQIDE